MERRIIASNVRKKLYNNILVEKYQFRCIILGKIYKGDRSVSMIKSIKVNLDVIEAMLYYWQATSEKEKVGSLYIISIADFKNGILI